MTFTHLQVHSSFTLLESTITIEALVKKAKEMKFQAIALTDHEVMHGAISFYQTCKNYDIKPIIGMTLDVGGSSAEEERCILLAKNEKGYKNLLKLSTLINRDHLKIELDELTNYNDGLLCIYPVQSNSLAQFFIDQEIDQAKKWVQKWQLIFSEDDFYLGVEDYGRAVDQSLHEEVKKFSLEQDVPAVAIQDVRYFHERDYLAYQCLRAIQANETWDMRKIDRDVKNRHLRSSEEMKKLFSNWPEVIINTEEISKKCNLSLSFHKPLLPKYPTPNGKNASQYLREICRNLLPERYSIPSDDVKKRLQEELQIIENMGFSDYFLIVWDFVKFAKEQKILVGPGRGSAAGSIVSYILGITEVDPLKYDLLFERFLNPERISKPDIDIDFADNRRDEVIHYVREKYGKDYVAQIVTFGTFGARSLLRELFRVMKTEPDEIRYLLRFFPTQSKETMLEQIQRKKELREYIQTSKSLKLLFKIAVTLEGIPRHLSTHAAGIVMSESPLIDHVPLMKGMGDTYLTQFAMDDLETIGLLKMDFLGLRNLTLIDRILRTIYFTRNKQITLRKIPMDDSETFQLLQEGRTNGIFQFESAGMKKVLRRLKPTNFEDLVAVNALYRPGPMDYIDTYIERKHKRAEISYPHPAIRSILEPTYGVLIYQEQIMQILHVMANFTYGEADVIRRAIQAKNEQQIQEKKAQFIERCIERGYEKKVAIEVFSWIEKFSNYGFNRSHAVSYSKISYQLAYLKAKDPICFYTELLNLHLHQKEKMYEYIKEIRQKGITLLPPSLNDSFGAFRVEEDGIRIGLLALPGINTQTVYAVLKERKKGNFKGLFDFCIRMPKKILQRKMLETLIFTGTFDKLHSNRKSLIASIDEAMEKRELFGEQLSFMAEELGMEESYIEMDDFPVLQKLKDEKELLGFYVSEHPLAKYRPHLQQIDCKSFAEIAKLPVGSKVKWVSFIQEIRRIRTRNGEPMAFLTLEDDTDEMEAIAFPDVYEREESLLIQDAMILATGKINERNQQKQLILQTLEPFSIKDLRNVNRKIFIKLIDDQYDETLKKVETIAHKYPGQTRIFIYHAKTKKTYQLASKYHVNPTKECLQALKEVFGADKVVFSQA